METKEIIREVVSFAERESNLSQALAVLSHRPFNMKGQEIEEIFGLLLKSVLERRFGIENPEVAVPQNKRKADIIFNFDSRQREFDIKSYGGAERFQLSTLKDILPELRGRFHGTEERNLNQEDKSWLIAVIEKLKIEYTLSFLSFIREGKEVDVHCFDFETLSIRSLSDLDFRLKVIGAEKRIQIYIPITESSTLEIAAGANPLNRGMWINKIMDPEDMDLIYATNFVNPIFKSKVSLSNFDKEKFIFDKAEKTMELIKAYFKD